MKCTYPAAERLACCLLTISSFAHRHALALQKSQTGQTAGLSQLPFSSHSCASNLIAEATRTGGSDAGVNRQEPEVEPGMTEHATHGPPLCKGHQEPCIKKRVNKSGPNKGEHLPSLHDWGTNIDGFCDVHAVLHVQTL